MLWGKNRGKWKRPAAAESRTQEHLAWATRALPLSHNSWYWMPHRTPCSHSVCAIKTQLGVDWKIVSIREENPCGVAVRKTIQHWFFPDGDNFLHAYSSPGFVTSLDSNPSMTRPSSDFFECLSAQSCDKRTEASRYSITVQMHDQLTICGQG